jgi:hypothetical protein
MNLSDHGMKDVTFVPSLSTENSRKSGESPVPSYQNAMPPFPKKELRVLP